MMPSVLIIDEHAFARLGLIRLLGEALEHASFGAAATHKAALRELAKRPWDLVVLEIAASRHDGLEFLRKVCSNYPYIPVLVVSMYQKYQYEDRARKLGAAGYVCKSATRAALLEAVRAALACKAPAPGAPPPAGVELSARERKVLESVASGKRTSQIAADLHLSAKTVSTYRRRILDKLGLQCTADLIAYALDHQPSRPPETEPRP
jgi:DNA-binding NarL/FixJ family response regulator